jgi:uncharacterized protein
MDNARKKQQMEIIRKSVGWVYPDLRWFSEKEASRAAGKRKERLKALSGWVSSSFEGTKLHSGPLSPGCLICGKGGWACNYINRLCTRHCFYCAQDRSIPKEGHSQTDGFIFKNPREHLLFLKAFPAQGVGFSGGEPLLELRRLLAHITAIRKEFGQSFYLWMYTNGDLLDRKILTRLRDAGLNEIRVDISARNYDLAPVALAKKYIPMVTVEIPAIPEDLDRLKRTVPKMEAIGVDFLNIHQLQACEFNYQAFRQRRYHFLHQQGVPVFESELAALEMLVFAMKHSLHLPIQYCCVAYKDRFQGRGLRMRRAQRVRRSFEEITPAGYFRFFCVSDSTVQMERMVHRLQEAHCPSSLWHCDERRTRLTFHRDLFPYVDWSSADVTVCYSEPGFELINPGEGFVDENLIPKNLIVYQKSGWSHATIKSWHQLYVEKMSPKEAFRLFFQNYPLGGKDAIVNLQKEAQELKKIAFWEELEEGLPEVF